jgi:hypothetical protein
MKAELPPAPEGLTTEDGFPQFGTYRGCVPEVDLRRLRGPFQPAALWRPVRRKRWQYALVATPEIAAAFAIADLTYTANAFAVVVDLLERRPLVDRGYLTLPLLASVNDRPGPGFTARFSAPGAELRSRRADGASSYEVKIDLKASGSPVAPGLAWRAQIEAPNTSPALTVIAPIDGGTVSLTTKWAGLVARGSISVSGKTYSLDEAVAGVDYTQGFMARHTAWRWAFACGRLSDGTSIGLNLVEGFTDTSPLSNENALWLGTELIPLDRARISFERDDIAGAWTLSTLDRAVDLRFEPIYIHRDERNYGIVRSRFRQPFGFFSGTISARGRRYEIEKLAGVTEDQNVLW